MLPNIRTSMANKAIVTELTQKLQLGAENIVARLAFAYSISTDVLLDLRKQQDAKGKEYSPKVLFGANNIAVYMAMICKKYCLTKTSTDVPKYIKLHLDDGLEKLAREYAKSAGLNSIDFLMPKIERGLTFL